MTEPDIFYAQIQPGARGTSRAELCLAEPLFTVACESEVYGATLHLKLAPVPKDTQTGVMRVKNPTGDKRLRYGK